MRTCLIFNPAAKGERAQALRSHLKSFERHCALLQTTAPGAGRTLAAQAVKDGFEIITAAGGDGTLNEVLNGIGDVPGGFEQVRLAVMPLGTVNVFAREIQMPFNVPQAWNVIQAGRERQLDLVAGEFTNRGRRERRYFAQMAGTGVDTQAIELVNWDLKKKIGPLAYVWAGLKALLCTRHQIQMSVGDPAQHYAQVLIGNGRYYGGSFAVFPHATLDDGKFDVIGVTRFNWFTLFKLAFTLPIKQHVRLREVKHLQTEKLTLTSRDRAGLEMEGELVGELPATIWIEQRRLRVIVP